MIKITNSYIVVAICCLLISITFFISCQPEESTDRIGDSGSMSSLLRTGYLDCIVEGGPYFPTSDSKTVTWGNNNKIIDIKYYNTLTDFVVEVRSTSGWSDLVINNTSVEYPRPVAANTWGVYSKPLATGWQASDRVNFSLKVVGHGQPAIFNVDYNLIGSCDNGCETSFMGEAISCGTSTEAREAIYTFTADADQDYIKIQGGLTNFTGEDAEITVSSENLTYSQSTPGGSSNRIIKVEGPVSECETITIHVRWNSSNNGGIITGDWSVKDENGLESAPSVPGLQCD